MGIKEYRRRNKLTQAQFAEQMEVDVRTAQIWENGGQYPHRKNRIKFKSLSQKADNPLPDEYFEAQTLISFCSGIPISLGFDRKYTGNRLVYLTILLLLAIAVTLFIVFKLFIL